MDLCEVCYIGSLCLGPHCLKHGLSLLQCRDHGSTEKFLHIIGTNELVRGNVPKLNGGMSTPPKRAGFQVFGNINPKVWSQSARRETSANLFSFHEPCCGGPTPKLENELVHPRQGVSTCWLCPHAHGFDFIILHGFSRWALLLPQSQDPSGQLQLSFLSLQLSPCVVACLQHCRQAGKLA